MNIEDKERIIDEELASLKRRYHELRKEYQNELVLEDKQIDSEGHHTTICSIPVEKHDEIKYKMRLCWVQAKSLTEELRRLTNQEEES